MTGMVSTVRVTGELVTEPLLFDTIT